MKISTPCKTCNPAVALALALAMALPKAMAQTDEAPTATPYRPSVSTPAALSAPGWLEVEAGGLRAGGGGARRDSLPYTFKLAVTPDWGVRLSAEAWVQQTDASGARQSGGGDSAVVLKRRFAVDDASAFGVELGATLPTAPAGIGSGKSDTSLTGIYSADLGQYHTDLNLGFTRVGLIAAGEGRIQTLWAASLSKALNERWGLVGEFSGTRREGVPSTSQFLVAASYNFSTALVFDAGLARSTRSHVPDWSAFAGFTWLAARIF